MSVYFVLAPAMSMLKIGFSEDVEKRLINLADASPCALELVGSIDGGRHVEHWCQVHCFSDRSHGEWFRYTDSVRSFVARVLSHGVHAARFMCPIELSRDNSEWKNNAPHLPDRRMRSPRFVATDRGMLQLDSLAELWHQRALATATPVDRCRCRNCSPMRVAGGEPVERSK